MELRDKVNDRGWWRFVLNKIMSILFGLYLIGWSMPFLDSATTHVNGQPVGIVGRWMMTIGGVMCVVYALFFKKYKKNHAVDMICPYCENPVMACALPPDYKCLKCGVQLEPLKGFYQRHSELKDLGNSFPEDLMDDFK